MSLRRLDAQEAAARARELGVDESRWAPGESFALGDALVRVGQPEAGEGYHREHLRLLHGAGEAAALGELLEELLEGSDDRLRHEARRPANGDPGWRRALEDAGLDLEVSLPEAWRMSDELVALETWGRPGRKRGDAPPLARSTTTEGRPLDVELRPATRETRAALAEFLGALVPGRSYPPGTLLSQAEQAETRRPGDLDADWVLAWGADGVVGGVVLEPDSRPERRHVRRLHVDVLPAFRGRGLAKRLLRAARERAAELGARRIEADPRAGHAAVIAALEAAGLERCGLERGAWRMRSPIASWDEDVLLLSAPAG